MFGILLGLGSLVTSGTLSNIFTAGSALKSVADQLNYDPKDLSLGEEILGRAKLASGLKGVGSLFTKPGPFDQGAGGAGGDGGAGGTGAKPGDVDFFGRPFVDPGLGSPGQNIQTDPTGGRVGAVTTETLAAPFGFDPALTTGGPEGQGFGFFNQGGLVSLLPRRATPAHSPPVWRPRY